MGPRPMSSRGIDATPVRAYQTYRRFSMVRRACHISAAFLRDNTRRNIVAVYACVFSLHKADRTQWVSWRQRCRRCLQGAPHDASALVGPESEANAVRTRSEAMGEGAQRPRDCRLCRPPKRSEVPIFLMPFSFLRRICSVSGRSAGKSLVRRCKAAPTRSFPLVAFWFPLVGTGWEWHRLCGEVRLLSSHWFFRCVAPGGNGDAKHRKVAATQWLTPCCSLRWRRSRRLRYTRTNGVAKVASEARGRDRSDLVITLRCCSSGSLWTLRGRVQVAPQHRRCEAAVHCGNRGSCSAA